MINNFLPKPICHGEGKALGTASIVPAAPPWLEEVPVDNPREHNFLAALHTAVVVGAPRPCKRGYGLALLVHPDPVNYLRGASYTSKREREREFDV